MRKVKFKGEIELESVDKATYDAYHIIPQSAQDVKNIPANQEKGTKVLENGRLYILHNGSKYNVQGNKVR
jgi:hypothetical protein